MKKEPRPFNPNLTAEMRDGFVAGLYLLHKQGNTWETISKKIGLGTSHVNRIKYEGYTPPPLPAFIHLADALGISLVELLCLGQED